MALTQVNANAIKDGAIDSTIINASVSLGGPRVSNVQIANSSWGVLDDTAIDTSGGYVIINGAGFASGCVVLFETTAATSVSFISPSQLRVEVPALVADTYNVYVNNPDGGTAIGVNKLTSSSVPTWNTASQLANTTSNTAYSYSLSANDATTYALQAGSSLPAGATLASNGLLSGTTTVESNTSYNFTVVATDAENQDSPRTFTLNIATVSSPPSVEYLIAAGGGGSTQEYNAGGGGGAGGLLTGNTNITGGTTYDVVVGAGGTTVTSGTAVNGTSSSAFGISTVGGGASGQYTSTNGRSGGSGGGAYFYPGTGGSGTGGQGYNGGNASWNGSTGGSGGGGGSAGAGSVVQAGPGTQSSIDGTAQYYAAGGVGVNVGGTPAGVTSLGRVSGNAPSNSGSGAGAGASGGSGIVIIRYADTYTAAVSTTGSPTYSVSGGYRVYKFTASGSITF